MYCTHRIFTSNPVSAVIVNTRNLILGMLGSSETLVGVVLIILLGCYLQSGPRIGSFLTPAQLNQVSGAQPAIVTGVSDLLVFGARQKQAKLPK